MFYKKYQRLNLNSSYMISCLKKVIHSLQLTFYQQFNRFLENNFNMFNFAVSHCLLDQLNFNIYYKDKFLITRKSSQLKIKNLSFAIIYKQNYLLFQISKRDKKKTVKIVNLSIINFFQTKTPAVLIANKVRYGRHSIKINTS